MLNVSPRRVKLCTTVKIWEFVSNTSRAGGSLYQRRFSNKCVSCGTLLSSWQRWEEAPKAARRHWGISLKAPICAWSHMRACVKTGRRDPTFPQMFLTFIYCSPSERLFLFCFFLFLWVHELGISTIVEVTRETKWSRSSYEANIPSSI